jgi:hypothetical protein
LFLDLCERIRAIIEGVSFQYHLRYFVLGGTQLRVIGLKKEWFDTGWEWYLGVDRTQSGLTDSECRQLMMQGYTRLDGESEHCWDIKIGSVATAEKLFESRDPGLRLNKDELRPDQLKRLPRRRAWTYFEIVKDPALVWESIREEGDIAIQLKKDLVCNRVGDSLDLVTHDRYRGSENNREKITLPIAILLLKMKSR